MDSTKLTIEQATADLNAGVQNLVIKALVAEAAQLRVQNSELQALVDSSKKLLEEQSELIKKLQKQGSDAIEVAKGLAEVGGKLADSAAKPRLN